MGEGLVVRPERSDDIEAVDALVGAAFDGRRNEVALVRGLRRAGGPVISLVALVGGDVAGHAMLSPLVVEGRPVSPLGLAPVSVHPRYQGRGVGSRLTEDALARADAEGAPFVVVLGDPGYYARFGFEPASGLGLVPPAGVRADACLVRRLAAYDPATVGRIAYPRLFADTGTL